MVPVRERVLFSPERILGEAPDYLYPLGSWGVWREVSRDLEPDLELGDGPGSVETVIDSQSSSPGYR